LSDYGYHDETLAYKRIGKNIEPDVILPVIREQATFSNEGKQFNYVLKGTYEFVYGHKKYILNAVDCVYFDSVIPHGDRGIGRGKAKILAILYSYKRT
jgi:hypothetical protein